MGTATFMLKLSVNCYILNNVEVSLALFVLLFDVKIGFIFQKKIIPILQINTATKIIFTLQSNRVNQTSC